MPHQSGQNTSPISLVGSGFYIEAMREALKDDSLWNQHTARTENTASPHYGCDDIWARYAPTLESGEHVSIWYPVVDKLPLKSLVAQVCEEVGAKELGGVLITRIPVGSSVKPHIDRGWHASYYTHKYGLSVEANDKQAFCFEKKQLVTKPGDLFQFDNSQLHWVTNDSDKPRITIIICTKK